jgi:hypothetical protein
VRGGDDGGEALHQPGNPTDYEQLDAGRRVEMIDYRLDKAPWRD